MIGDWQDEWDLKRRGSNRSLNRHDTCSVAAYLNKANPAGAKGIVADASLAARRFDACFMPESVIKSEGKGIFIGA